MNLETTGTPYAKPEPRPAKLQQPLKRTPIKSNGKPIAKVSEKRKALIESGLFILKVGKPLKRVSAKQAKIENEKSKVYRERSEGERPSCRGCGRFDVPLSNSHRIGQSNKEHVANPNNLDTYCTDGKDCHRLYESGRLYLLDNGNDVLEWLAAADFERYRTKLFKMIDRIQDDNLSLEDLPGWVEQHINTI